MSRKVKYLFITAIFATLFAVSGYSVSAQSPTATDSANTIRDSVKQKVDQELSQIKQGVAKKGFVGSITSISDASLSLTNIYSQPRKVLITAASTIKLIDGTDGTPADLKAGQYILVMGNVDSQDTMTASRLLVIAKPDADTRQVVFGKVSQSTSASFTLNSSTYKILTTTKFTNQTKAADLTSGAKVLAIVSGAAASRIQLVSPAPSATPAASSPSATPKP